MSAIKNKPSIGDLKIRILFLEKSILESENNIATCIKIVDERLKYMEHKFNLLEEDIANIAMRISGQNSIENCSHIFECIQQAINEEPNAQCIKCGYKPHN